MLRSTRSTTTRNNRGSNRKSTTRNRNDDPRWWTLRRFLHVPITQGLSKALLVAIFTAAPLALIDCALATNLHLTPLVRLPALIVVFAICFPIIARQLSVFVEVDFTLLENALPQLLRPSLDVIEHLLIRESAGLRRDII